MGASNGFEPMRLGTYQRDSNVDGWLASELLDGVRAYWDGKDLYTRLGTLIKVPSDFTAGFPPYPLDGELYTKRKDYANISTIVMAKTPDPGWSGWAQITYNVFDAPKAQGGLLARLAKVNEWIEQNPKVKSRMKIIKQTKIKNKQELAKMFEEIIASGGEGVVIRDPEAAYKPGVSDKNLKYKAYNDAECEVTAYKPIKGQTSLKSFECKLPSGKLMRIAVGLNTEVQLPKVGEVITYTYQKIGKGGLPESPTYLRVRQDP